MPAKVLKRLISERFAATRPSDDPVTCVSEPVCESKSTLDIVRFRSAVCALVTVCLVPTLGWAQDGALIANDGELFSTRFLAAFQEMNDTFADYGFEIEVAEGEQPVLSAITAKYGDPDRSDEVDVVLGFGANERPVTLVFFYYGDVGFGVRPDDSQQLVVRVKRREG